MRILFVHMGLQTFVKKDLDILCSAYETRVVQFTGRSGLARQLAPDLWRLWQGVLWCDMTFSWFGKLHAFFAVLFSKMLGKKAAVVAGNDDVSKYVSGEHAFGMLTHPVKKWFAYFIFKYADRTLAVSKLSQDEAIGNAGAAPEKTSMIYHGFDPTVFIKAPDVRKQRLVVTVGRIAGETYIGKGLKLFVETANLFPDVRFFLVGPVLDPSSDEKLKAIAPTNVTFTGWVKEERLITILSEASVYVQASLHEGFGCSIAEAMLCECVPVVANWTAMPEVVGPCGFYIERLEPDELAAKIRMALARPEMGRLARQRIVECFPLERRRNEMLQVIRSIENATFGRTRA